MSCTCENKCSEPTTGCSCYGNGIVIPTGPQGEQGEQGPQGIQGEQGIQGIQGIQGVSVSDSFISDGETEIGGVVYPVNTIVLELSDGTFIDSGTLTFSLNWQNISLINGWVASISGGTPQYAIDALGFLHLRGGLNGTDKTNDIFADFSAIIPNNTRIWRGGCFCNQFTANNNFKAGLFNITGANQLSLTIIDYLGGPWYLDSLPPYDITQ